MEQKDFDERKFRELVKYIAVKSTNDPAFGRTKLNKTLFYCDFLAYIHLGDPVTGERYHKEPYGPVPNHIRAVLTRMKEDGEIAEAVVEPFGGYEQHRPVALQAPDLSLFKPEEIAWIDHVIEQSRDPNATEVSNLSHKFQGWQVAEMGEEIPYESALFSPGEPIREEIEHAKALEEEAGNVTSGEEDWTRISNLSERSDPDGTPPESEMEPPFEQEQHTGPADSHNGGGSFRETGEYPPEEPVTPSWERRREIGLGSALFKTIGEVLFHPVTAFSHVPMVGGLGGPLLFAVLLGTAVSVFKLSAYYSFIGQTSLAKLLAEMLGPEVGARATIVIILAALSPITITISTLVGAGILHLFLMLFGGATRGFEATFKVVAYVRGAGAVLEIIPICGTLIFLVWGMVVGIIGAREVHKTNT